MLTSNEIAGRLKNKMGDIKYSEMIKTIETEFRQLTQDNEKDFSILDKLYSKHIYPHIRQNGMKIEIKERYIIVDTNNNIFRFCSDFGQTLYEQFISAFPEMNGKEFEDVYEQFINFGVATGNLCKILHTSLWANNNIYHWGLTKFGMYGAEETDKEIVNDWKVSSKYPKTYFTMYTHNEIKKFCDDWNQKNTYNTSKNNCSQFIDSLINFMALTEFSV